MDSFFLFIKGLFVGIGKIIPGFSGSLIATLLGVYEKSIYSLNHLKDHFKESILYLLPLGAGVIFSVILFSHIIAYFLNEHYSVTMLFFLGLILGTIPKFKKEFTMKKKKEIFVFILGFFIPYCLSIFTSSNEFFPNASILSYLFLFFLGFLDALTMIIPGISGTALFFMLGSYSFYLLLLQNPLAHISWTIVVGMGLLFGIFFTSRLVEHCMCRNKNLFYVFIYGLLWSSIVSFFFLICYQITFFGLGFLIVGFVISCYFS